jgi:uncharacterized BrkB/YihY/UPF0761 family membrane protein
VATIIYGWYLTRFADYSIVYGSLGAGIATLVWLYMVSLSVLIGAEFNAQLFPLAEGGLANRIVEAEAGAEPAAGEI